MRQLNCNRVLLTLCVVVVMLAGVSCCPGGMPSLVESTPTPKPIVDLDYFVLVDKERDMTEVQWNTYRESLIGTRVRWTGLVKDAVGADSGGELRITMVEGDRHSSSITDALCRLSDALVRAIGDGDVYLPIPKDDLLKYNKGQRVIWEGDIKHISYDGFEVHFESVKMISP